MKPGLDFNLCTRIKCPNMYFNGYTYRCKLVDKFCNAKKSHHKCPIFQDCIFREIQLILSSFEVDIYYPYCKCGEQI